MLLMNSGCYATKFDGRVRGMLGTVKLEGYHGAIACFLYPLKNFYFFFFFSCFDHLPNPAV